MRRILFTLCLFMMLPMALFGQTSNGDIIAITYTSGNTTYYLKAPVANGDVTRTTSADLSCLWEVSVVSNGNYALKNVSTGYYLTSNGTGNRARIQVSSTSQTTTWTYPNNHYNRGSKALNWNDLLGYYMLGGTLTTSTTATKFTKTTTTTTPTYSITATPKSSTVNGFADNGVVQINSDFTRTYQETTTYRSGSTTIQVGPSNKDEKFENLTPTYTSSESWLTVDANGSVSVTQNPSTTASRTATITITYTENGTNYTETVTVTQQANVPQAATGLIHQQGASGRPLMSNNMQGVHTYKTIVYVPTGQSVTLKLPETSKMLNYCRWYNYKTDRSDNNIARPNGFTNVAWGTYRIGQAANATYNMPTNGSATTIACDVSNYQDYTQGTNSFTEPTLSYRAIFEIRPSSEMAAKMNTSTYYEEHDIIAPAGATLNLGLDYEYTNYYYSSNQQMGTKSNWSMSGTNAPANTNDNFLLADRYFRFTAPTTAGNYVYEVKYTADRNSTWKVAKFNVTVKAAGDVRSAANGEVKTHETLDRLFIEGPQQNFDNYNGTMPLEWDEISYGFAKYPNMTRDIDGQGVTGRTQANNTDSRYACWGEYSLLTRSNGWGGAPTVTGNSTFLYIDAASAPGTVATLSIDGDLCPGTKLLFAARVSNMNGNQTQPNLNFEVVGVIKDPTTGAITEKAITTFTTGDVATGGAWYQYMFDITMEDNNVTYDEFRLRIVNNGANTQGNDFAIDDIQIWKGKNPVMPYQGNISCSAGNNIMAVTRINYANTVNLESDFYYQWRSSEGKMTTIGGTKVGSPVDIEYVDQPSDKSKKWGVITHDKFVLYGQTLPTGALYANLDAIVDDVKDPSSTGFAHVNHYGYVHEIEDGVDVYVMYIVHEVSNTIMKPGEEYTIELTSATIVTTGYPDFGASDDRCGKSGVITVKVPLATQVNADIIYSPIANTLCAQSINSLRPVITNTYTENDEIKTIEGTCYSDWLTFEMPAKATDYIEAYPTATRKEVEDALSHLRAVSITANTMEGITPQGTLTNANITLLSDLEVSGLLSLYEDVHYEYINAGEKKTITYYPIAGTGTNGVEICGGNASIQLVGKAQPNFILKFGNPDKEYKEGDASDNVVAATRIYLNEKSNIEMPIRLIDNATITGFDLIPEFTTDPAFTSPVHINMKAAELARLSSFSSQTLSYSNPAIVTIDGSALNLKEGYEYAIQATFHATDDPQSECGEAYNYFLIKVVPETAVWMPMAESNAWNNDKNWRTADENGVVIRSGFVPRESTNAIIRANEEGAYPILPTVEDGQEAGYQAFIDYDMKYTNAQCKNIQFEAGAMMENQNILRYENAFVDMAIQATRWTMVGMPMQSMYSGDFYVPTTESAKPFETTNYDGNYNIQFWQKMHNDNTPHNVSWSSVENVTIQTTENNWTTNFNGVNQSYAPGLGTAVWAVDEAKGDDDYVIVRWPKTETELFYYSYGNKTNISEATPRNEGNKLAFNDEGQQYTLTTKDGEYFIFGNPTMAYIDVEKFIQDNSSVLEGEYTYYHATSGNTLAWTATTVTLNGNTNATSSVVTYEDQIPGFIAPMRAIMLKAKSKGSVTVSLKASHLTSKPTKPSALNATGALYMTATNSDHTTFAAIYEDAAANNDYRKSEDAEMVLSNSDLTPSALYTVADDKALAVNTVNNINNVPVAVYTATTSSATISFQGADSFNGELYLLDAQTNTRTLIENNKNITITTTKAGDPIRYFIQKVADETTGIDMTTNEGINIFVQPDGSITVASNDILTEVNVYNGAGQRVLHQTANDQVVGLSLPAGVYAIQAVSLNETKTQKVVVK